MDPKAKVLGVIYRVILVEAFNGRHSKGEGTFVNQVISAYERNKS